MKSKDTHNFVHIEHCAFIDFPKECASCGRAICKRDYEDEGLVSGDYEDNL